MKLFRRHKGNKPQQAKVGLLRKMNQSVQVNVPDDNYRINQQTGAVERIDKKLHTTKKQRRKTRVAIRAKMAEYEQRQEKAADAGNSKTTAR